MTSLEKQRLAAFVNEKKKAQFSQLANSSNNSNSGLGWCFFPPNGSGIFKETQKLFSWQEPNLAAGRGKVVTDHQRVPGGKELHIPPLPAASSCPFPSPGSLDTPISIS